MSATTTAAHINSANSELPAGVACDPGIACAQPDREVSAARAVAGSNSQLLQLADCIKSLIAEGDDAKAAAKAARAEAKNSQAKAKASRAAAEQKFTEAGKLLLDTQERAPDFKRFLKDFGISRSRAYELMRIAGGQLEEVRAEAAERKRRQRAQTATAIRDTADVTDTAPRNGVQAKPPVSGPTSVRDITAVTDTAPGDNAVPRPTVIVPGSDPRAAEQEVQTSSPKAPAPQTPEQLPSKSSSKHKHQSERCREELKFSIRTWGPGLNGADRSEVIELLRAQASRAA